MGVVKWPISSHIYRVEAKEQSRAEPKKEFEENVKRRKISMFWLKRGRTQKLSENSEARQNSEVRQNSEAERQLISW